MLLEKGAAQVIKLTNAIPANWLSKGVESVDFDDRGKALASPKLRDIGLSMRLQMGMVQNGMTMLTLQTEGSKAVLTGVQVFDGQGKPWPTFMQNEDGAETCELYVAGKPAAPLSLALLASGGGGSVQVPLLAEHIPITRSTNPQAKATQPQTEPIPHAP